MRRRGALSGTPLSCPRTKGFVFEPRSAVRCRARHARAMLAPGSSCDHEDPGARDDPRPRPPRRAARRAGAAGGKIPRVGFIVMARKADVESSFPRGLRDLGYLQGRIGSPRCSGSKLEG
jgi:hypothetical protein